MIPPLLRVFPASWRRQLLYRLSLLSGRHFQKGDTCSRCRGTGTSPAHRFARRSARRRPPGGRAAEPRRGTTRAFAARASAQREWPVARARCRWCPARRSWDPPRTPWMRAGLLVHCPVVHYSRANPGRWGPPSRRRHPHRLLRRHPHPHRHSRRLRRHRSQGVESTGPGRRVRRRRRGRPIPGADPQLD
jgi:hypothetical protein